MKTNGPGSLPREISCNRPCEAPFLRPLCPDRVHSCPRLERTRHICLGIEVTKARLVSHFSLGPSMRPQACEIDDGAYEGVGGTDGGESVIPARGCDRWDVK